MRVTNNNLTPRVVGVGINDTGLPTGYSVNGIFIKCPFYVRWKSMLERAYSEKVKSKLPTYQNVLVVEEWHKLSNFKSWMQSQDWEGKDLDKDILIKGNKVYGPDTCCFIPSRINTMLTLALPGSTKYSFGVTKKSDTKYLGNGHSRPYIAILTVTVDGKKSRRNLGYSDTEIGAHKIWQLCKAASIEEVVAWYATQPCFSYRCSRCIDFPSVAA